MEPMENQNGVRGLWIAVMDGRGWREGAALIRLVREVSDLETFGEGVRVGKSVSASQSHTS